jgi:hypothetical protein
MLTVNGHTKAIRIFKFDEDTSVKSKFDRNLVNSLCSHLVDGPTPPVRPAETIDTQHLFRA